MSRAKSISSDIDINLLNLNGNAQPSTNEVKAADNTYIRENTNIQIPQSQGLSKLADRIEQYSEFSQSQGLSKLADRIEKDIINRNSLIRITAILFVSLICTWLILCNIKNDNKRLLLANNKLNSEVTSLNRKISDLQYLELENTKLKQTANYHYQNGIVLLNNESYEDAKKEFEFVINNYPHDVLAKYANEQLQKVLKIITKREREKQIAQALEEKKRKDQQTWIDQINSQLSQYYFIWHRDARTYATWYGGDEKSPKNILLERDTKRMTENQVRQMFRDVDSRDIRDKYVRDWLIKVRGY